MFENSPRPVRGWHLLAPELFSQSVLTEVLQDNSGWLRMKARSTREIHNNLFPDYDKSGMGITEILSAINEALVALEYLPTDETPNPLWVPPSRSTSALEGQWR